MVRWLAVALALMACVPEPPGPGPGPGKGPMPGPDCPGGEVVYGMAGPTCAKPTPDAGKACAKASDCQGHCLAETRTCSRLSPQFGCFEVLMENGQAAGLCVD